MIKNVEEINKKQAETEKKIETLTKKNDDYIQKNKILIDELKDNK